MIKNLLLAGAVLVSGIISAQKAHQCETLMPWQEPDVVATHSPEELKDMEANFKSFIKKAQANYQQGKKELIRIPMVVHIIHEGGRENISDQAVNNAIDILNEDFQGKHPDVGNVFDEHQDIIADVGVEFRLAKLDPDGNCTSGIVRHKVPNAYFAEPGASRFQIEAYKRDFHWPTDQYMNVYVVGSISESGGGRTLGYATFPRSTPFSTDGFVTIYEGFGSRGTIGGTATHEIGHYLALPHTFANTNNAGVPENCNDDDGIEDTPLTTGYFSTCPPKPQCYTCPTAQDPNGSLDNLRNVMDYASCSANFTNGQKAVMLAVLANQRKKLVSEENIAEVGADYEIASAPEYLCTAAFEANVEEEYCPGKEIEFTSYVTHGAIEYSWEFEGGTPATSSEQFPDVVYNSTGTFDVTLTVTDGDTTITILKEDYVKIKDNNALGQELVEDFENMDFDNTDVFSIENVDGDSRTWKIADVGFNSSKSAYIENNANIAGRIDRLVTNTMDNVNIQDELYINFDFAFAQKNTDNDDKLVVQFSKDCGETWITRKTIKGSSLATADPVNGDVFEPTNDQWDSQGISIGQYAAEGFLARLEFTSDGGNNIYIDNFFIGRKSQLSISEAEVARNISVYPNPSKGELNVSSDYEKIDRVEVRDITGKLVMVKLVNEYTTKLDMSQNKTGIYLVKVLSDNGVSKNVRFVLN